MDIRTYIKSQLLPPLKRFSTPVQETLLEIITWRLEELYELTIKFPEIVSPNKNRLDILQAIIEQFQFSIRNEARIEEQIAIIDNILKVYNRRGSIDSIENMWKYYGGDLPKEVKVNIPSYNLFRYSISSWSGTHVFQDNNVNRPGVYEIELFNNKYPLDKLKDFLLKELVAAGTRIYFKNTIRNIMSSGDVVGDSSSHFIYDPHRTIINIYIKEIVSNTINGLIFSGNAALSADSRTTWSGRLNLFLKYTKLIKNVVQNNKFYYDVRDLAMKVVTKISQSEEHYYDDETGLTLIRYINTSTRYIYNLRKRDTKLSSMKYTYCTPSEEYYAIVRNLYDKEGNLIEKTSKYPGFFVLYDSALGEEVI